jgi:sugar lactone lactonase YvrE
VTCCAFGGDDLDTLYVTTSRLHLNEEELAAQPHAGGVFALKPGVKGLSKPPVEG